MGINDRNEKSQILTLRIPKTLKDSLDEISTIKLNSKLSRTAQNYLKLSEIMIVREDNTKISWDNSKLTIYPDRFLKLVFDQLTKKLNDDEKFSVWAQFGDDLAQYLNDIIAVRNIEQTDYLKVFKMIKAMGWFDYSTHVLSDSKDMILIPKSFGNMPFVYAFVYRLIEKTRYPPEWNWNVLLNRYPGDADKDKKDYKKWYDRNYIPSIQNQLQVDEDMQSKHNFYYFRRLAIDKFSSDQ